MLPRKLFVAFPLRRMALAAAFLLTLLAGLPSVRAQDRLVFKDGHVQEGKIIGMNGNTVLMSIAAGAGKGQIGYDLGLVARVDSPPPPAYQTGYAAYQAGEWDKALAALKSVVNQYRSLPTEWERQAVASLGDLYIEKGDIPKAEAAYTDFRNYYPFGAGTAARTSLGQARIALARKDPALAKQKLEPLTQAALKNPAQVTSAEGAVFGKAFYLLGQLHESEGNLQAALEDYLRTVTLFYQDKATAAAAQKSADALRVAHKDLIAP